MDRKWIRIDRAHRTFDCSPGEFESLLVEARCQDDGGGVSGPTFRPDDPEVARIEADDFQLQEAINAELALLANLQRRERIVKSELEQAEETQNRVQQSQILADQHAECLQYEQNRTP